MTDNSNRACVRGHVFMMNDVERGNIPLWTRMSNSLLIRRFKIR